MGETWQILAQLEEIQKRHNETYNLLVEIGGVLPDAQAEGPTPENPSTDIGKVRLIISHLTETSQVNLTLAGQIHGCF